jgi:hypothetical protein
LWFKVSRNINSQKTCQNLWDGVLDVDLKRQHFEIEIDGESFLALRSSASKHSKPVKQLASEILKEKLKAA